jgi:ribonuclease R
MKVEREVVAFYACLMVKGRIGEEFDATVSGLAEQGFFCELNGLYVEGMVRPSGWKFDQRAFRGLLGGGRVVKVGLPLRVRLTSVNLDARKIDLEIVAMQGAEVKAKPAEVRRKGHAPKPMHKAKDRGRQKSHHRR